MSKQDDKTMARWVDCPGCKRKVRYSLDNPFRPFCSARCKEIDIAAWASETYRIPVALTESGDEDLLVVEDDAPYCVV